MGSGKNGSLKDRRKTCLVSKTPTLKSWVNPNRSEPQFSQQ